LIESFGFFGDDFDVLGEVFVETDKVFLDGSLDELGVQINSRERIFDFVGNASSKVIECGDGFNAFELELEFFVFGLVNEFVEDEVFADVSFFYEVVFGILVANAELFADIFLFVEEFDHIPEGAIGHYLIHFCKGAVGFGFAS